MVSGQMAIVDGPLMVSYIQKLGYVPVVDFDEVQELRDEADRRAKLAPRYDHAGFNAMGDKFRAEARALERQASEIEYQIKLKHWRDQGYFVITTPEWDDRLQIEGMRFTIPYKVVSTKRRLARFGDYQALYSVPIRNWVGDVPIQVLEAVEQFKTIFSDLRIMFVAKRNQVKNLVANFVQQDPILVGVIGPSHMVVLKMWGDDLQELSLALLDPELKGANR